ncbi:MAG: YdeI/OmpD-associated family protein [Polyangiales bacterium]
MAGADRQRRAASKRDASGEAPTLTFRGESEFAAWLEQHSDSPAGVWLKLAKKNSGVPSLTDLEAVDVGLCYGWISGQRKSLDDQFYLQKYVPRRPRSRWSQVNVANVERLIAAGRMRPPGIAEVDAAKADGRWAAAYASQRNAEIPADLRAALDAKPAAGRQFAALGKTEQYNLMLGLLTARTAAARKAQLERLLHKLTSSRQSKRDSG